MKRYQVWAGVGPSLLLLGLSACAGQGAHGALAGARGDTGEQALYPGDPEGPPRMEGLPECDVPREKLSEEMRRAWLLAEEALAVGPPVEPGDESSTVLAQWSDTALKEWMGEKASRAMAARQALNEAAAHNPRERILAGALLGLVFEDVAVVLVDLPTPAELASEPEVARVYREVLMSNAKPYLSNAYSAYRACAGNARNGHLLGHWARYCDRRAEGLPGGHEVEPGTTEVIVIRE